MVVCQKTEWVRRAIELNPYKCDPEDQFIWVDFGLFHFYDHLEMTHEQQIDRFNNAITNLQSTQTTRVRLPHIWGLNLQPIGDGHKHQVCWDACWFTFWWKPKCT